MNNRTLYTFFCISYSVTLIYIYGNLILTIYNTINPTPIFNNTINIPSLFNNTTTTQLLIMVLLLQVEQQEQE